MTSDIDWDLANELLAAPFECPYCDYEEYDWDEFFCHVTSHDVQQEPTHD